LAFAKGKASRHLIHRPNCFTFLTTTNTPNATKIETNACTGLSPKVATTKTKAMRPNKDSSSDTKTVTNNWLPYFTDKPNLNLLGLLIGKQPLLARFYFSKKENPAIF